MTPYPYMISIQWGKGHHYFRDGAFTFAEVSALAQKYYDESQRTRNRGKHKPPQPRVMIWELRESVQDSSVGALTWEIQL